MSYREMKTTPPARPAWWKVCPKWRAVAGLVIVSFVGAAVVKGVGWFVDATAADILRRDELAAGVRAARAAECIRGGGTWNVGTVDGKPAEWCARGQR